MQARITLITLAVDDLERAVAFYRDGLGWATRGIVGTEFEHVAVADAGLPLQAASATHVCLAHNVGSRSEQQTC